jgi:hypothetical protein
MHAAVELQNVKYLIDNQYEISYSMDRTNVPIRRNLMTSMPFQCSSLKNLEILVGTWEVSGDVQGEIRFEWMEGGFFLMQHVDLEQGAYKYKGIEIIGHELGFGAALPSEDIKSRYYDTMGNTFEYVYDVEGDTLTIWGGERNSVAYFRGRFSQDGDKISGAWTWPGGGYKSNMTRVKHTA